MQKQFFLFLFLALSLSFRPADDPSAYPQDYFGYPVTQPMRLSGTFGELRPGHFHSGIDIKGAIGHPLYAAADGYVSAIGVSPGGYGNALFIQHPNGYTTVYGHMSEFAPELADYARRQQHQLRQFEVELQLEPGRFPVKKGDVIGKMGSTGHSFGPHLHFEIRKTDTEQPINPLLFGLKVQDTEPPRLFFLRVYSLDKEGNSLQARNIGLTGGQGKYGVEGGVIQAPAEFAGFGISVNDFMNEVSNRNGIFALQLYAGDSLVYAFDFETVPFEETRFINAHMDYGEQVGNSRYFHRCYRLPGNGLSIYRAQKNRGIVAVPSDGNEVPVSIITRDLAGNEARLDFRLRRGASTPAGEKEYRYLLARDSAHLIDEYGLLLRFAPQSFYEDLAFRYEATDERSDGVFSAVHSVHDFQTPVHKPFEIAIRPTLLPDELREKAFIAYCGPGQSIGNSGGRWVDGLLATHSRLFGEYCIMIDLVPPTIEPLQFQEDLRGKSSISFRIQDNYYTLGDEPGMTYEAAIDGKWVLLEFDEMHSILTHRFAADLAAGRHQFMLKVKDRLGNERVFESKFIR